MSLNKDDQLTVCQPFANLQRTEHSRGDLQDERNASVRNACVSNNASNGNRQRNRRIYFAFGFGLNRHKWSNKSVPSIQTMVWEGQRKGHGTTLRSQNTEQLRENGWLMLRSCVRASPSGAQAHRIPKCCCIN